MQKILFVLLVVAPPVFADSAICTREYAPVCGEYKGEKKNLPDTLRHEERKSQVAVRWRMPSTHHRKEKAR